LIEGHSRGRPSREAKRLLGRQRRLVNALRPVRRAEGWRIIEGMRGGLLSRQVAGRLRRCAASLLDKGDEMTKTAQDIIAGVEVLTIVTECYGGGGPGGTDKRGETKMTVLVGESGAMSIMNAIHAAGFVIVSNDALKAGSDGYG